MMRLDALTDLATLDTEHLRLVPLGPEHFDGAWAALQDEEVRRLTGTHATFTEPQIRDWLATRAGTDDRADWAITLRTTGEYLGEVVLNELDETTQRMSFRIALAGPHVFGRGYGTEATRAAVAYAFDVVGLHRLDLEVVAFNERAQRAYEKAGFVREGVLRDAWFWDGVWSDVVVMSIVAGRP